MKLQRYKFFRDPVSDCYCEIDDSVHGDYVLYREAEALEKRNQELEAQLAESEEIQKQHHDLAFRVTKQMVYYEDALQKILDLQGKLSEGKIPNVTQAFEETGYIASEVLDKYFMGK